MDGDAPTLDGDVLEEGACAYDSDFAYFKPKADALFLGACHAQRGQPTDMRVATFGLGGMKKSLAVFGDRPIEKRFLRKSVGDATPFLTMPLTWTRALKTDGNPVGRDGRTDGLAPNIECTESRDANKVAAGLGPILRTWKLRQDKMGTYKGDYLEKRWPWFPDDFDWTHFQAAPEDQQIEGYLKGDEEIYLSGLHPEHDEFRGQLPGLCVRAFVNGCEDGVEDFREVEMHLDTAIVDGEANTVTLLWRGMLPVVDQDHQELHHVYFAEEPLAKHASLEAHRDAFAARAFSEEEEEEAEPQLSEAAEIAAAEPAAVEVEEALDEAPATNDVADKRAEEQLQKIEEELRKVLEQSQLAPAVVDEVLAKMAAGESLDPTIFAAMLPPVDSVDLEAVMADAREKSMTALKEFGVDVQPLVEAEAELAEMKAAEKAAAEAAADIEPEAESAPAVEADDGLTRAKVEAMHAQGASLKGLDLTGLDLAGVDLGGADLTGAIATAVVFDGATLAGATLQDAALAGASLLAVDLSAANLRGADLTGATLAGAQLAKAQLVDVDAAGADLSKVALVEVVARDANFEGADLRGADCSAAQFESANFSGAQLDGASFAEAKMPEASLEAVRGTGVDFTSADLVGVRADKETSLPDACCVGVDATGANLSGADLSRAQFVRAKLIDVLFVETKLIGADLSGSDYRQANFTKADLSTAGMVRGNGMHAVFDRAILTEADLSHGNYYEAEFLDAVMSGARIEGAFLKGSKLANAKETL